MTAREGPLRGGLASVFGPAAARRSRGGPARSRHTGSATSPEPGRTERRDEERRAPARRRSRPPAPRIVRDPEQVDLLLLAAVDTTPRGRAELVERIRRRTSGRFLPAREPVLRRLIYLERNRLLVRARGGYRVTELGERVLDSRARRLRLFAEGVETLLAAGTDD